MLDESLRRRIEALNHTTLPEHPTLRLRSIRPAPSHKAAVPRAPIVTTAAAEPLTGLLRSADVVEVSTGAHLRMRIPLERFWPNGARRVLARHAELAQQMSNEPAKTFHPELAAFVRSFPAGTVLLDLETCGWAGSALFLIGLLRWIDQRLTLELLLARNYAEERHILESFWQVARTSDVLVTFNGKSFDWPMVIDRSQRYRMFGQEKQPELQHIDLLHHARRRWRRTLPDCRLQTLERHVCHRTRRGDIPGSQIPAAYADFVRTGFAREMETILYHNALDLVSLLDLTMRIAA